MEGMKNTLYTLGCFPIFKLGDLRLFLTGTCYSIQETQVTGAALTPTTDHTDSKVILEIPVLHL